MGAPARQGAARTRTYYASSGTHRSLYTNVIAPAVVTAEKPRAQLTQSSRTLKRSSDYGFLGAFGSAAFGIGCCKSTAEELHTPCSSRCSLIQSREATADSPVKATRSSVAFCLGIAFKISVGMCSLSRASEPAAGSITMAPHL